MTESITHINMINNDYALGKNPRSEARKFFNNMVVNSSLVSMEEQYIEIDKVVDYMCEHEPSADYAIEFGNELTSLYNHHIGIEYRALSKIDKIKLFFNLLD